MLHELNLGNQSTPNAPEISVFGPADENGRAPPTNFSTFRSEQGDNVTSVVRAIQPQPRQPPVARIFRNPPPTCSGYPYGWKPTAVDRTLHEVSEHPDLATKAMQTSSPVVALRVVEKEISYLSLLMTFYSDLTTMMMACLAPCAIILFFFQ